MSLNVSAYSIRNPLVAILLFTLLTLGGIYGFMQMKVQQFPDIDFPGVITTVTLQGASPSQLENDVAKKIENKIASIEGVKHIRTTVQTGAVTVATEFVLEKDIQEAVDDVRSAVSEVKGDLPAAANDPIISKVTTAGLPVVTYTVAADNVSVADLSWFVDDTITKRLSDIKGVSSVSRVGGLERQVTVAVDPATLNATRLPITQLSQQITGIQQDASGGQTEVGGDTQTIRVLGAVQNARNLPTCKWHCHQVARKRLVAWRPLPTARLIRLPSPNLMVKPWLPSMLPALEGQVKSKSLKRWRLRLPSLPLRCPIITSKKCSTEPRQLMRIIKPRYEC